MRLLPIIAMTAALAQAGCADESAPSPPAADDDTQADDDTVADDDCVQPELDNPFPEFVENQLSSDADWLHVACGRYHTCGIRGDGRMECFGGNAWDQCEVP